MTSKQQILEPITCIAKLSLLTFMGQSIKITISDHGIHYDDPETTSYIQHVIGRKIRGDGREDIAVLNNAIVNYLDWYIINNPTNSKRKYIKLAIFAINGLRKLQKTYNSNSNNVVLTLQFYINLINTVIANDSVFRDKVAFAKLLPVFAEEKINLVDTDQVKKIWDETDVDKLYDEINDCFDMNNEKKVNEFIDAKVRGLIEILEKKDQFFTEIIKKSYGSS
jgi:hypothetical protein